MAGFSLRDFFFKCYILKHQGCQEVWTGVKYFQSEAKFVAVIQPFVLRFVSQFPDPRIPRTVQNSPNPNTKFQMDHWIKFERGENSDG